MGLSTTDIRADNWSHVQTLLPDQMRQVYNAWIDLGPCTTRDLASRAGIDLLNVRPRTTDLVELGLVKLAGRHGREGIYAARTPGELASLPPPPLCQPELWAATSSRR